VYAGTAFTELVLDRSIPEERFVLQVPRGARVRYYRQFRLKIRREAQ